ncbi:unnamed protein product [Symbiodinium sp. CCMP2592]|nr:unnamed protein product [Symbiodinium sp. CCMP2592]
MTYYLTNFRDKALNGVFEPVLGEALIKYVGVLVRFDVPFSCASLAPDEIRYEADDWSCHRLGLMLSYNPERTLRRWAITKLNDREAFVAISKDSKAWYFGEQLPSVTAPVVALRTWPRGRPNRLVSAQGILMHILTFTGQLKSLSGSYEADGREHDGAPSYVRSSHADCRLFLRTESTGLWIICNEHSKFATSHNMRDWELVGQNPTFERADCTVVDMPTEPEPSSSSVPDTLEASDAPSKRRRTFLGYDMKAVRGFYSEMAHSPIHLAVRPNEDADLKVIYEIFHRQATRNHMKHLEYHVYRPSKAAFLLQLRSAAPGVPPECLLDLGAHLGAASAWWLGLPGHLGSIEAYEPSHTFELLQKNLGHDARVRLHQKAVVAETSCSKIGRGILKAHAAAADPHSDSVVIRSGAHTFYFKQVNTFLTLTMATTLTGISLGSKFHKRMRPCASLDERMKAMEAELPELKSLGSHVGSGFGPTQRDSRFWTQTSATTWHDEKGRLLEKKDKGSFRKWLEEINAQPCLCFSDYEGNQRIGSWKSSAASCQTLRLTPTAMRLVPAVSFDDALTEHHTIIKMDVEGSELQLLAKPRDWKNTRLLIFEFSAGRCRHFGVGPLAFASILDALKAAGFSHLHLESKSIGTTNFWLRDQLSANLDFMVFAQRGDAGIPAQEAARMNDLMENLPKKLRELSGFPEGPARAERKN